MKASSRPETPALATTRRGFLAAAGGLTFIVTLGAGLAAASGEAGAQADGPLRPNAWVTLSPDDTITVTVPTGEMGQGTLTALPLILAEELDADWSKVRTEFAPANARVYGNPHPLLNGGQASLASIAVPGYWMPLRTAGAQARRVLLDAVAAKWGVPVAELSTESGRVVHAKTGQRITYGEVVKFTTLPAELPKITPADLKKPEQFKLVGRTDIGRSDVASKTNGTAVYGIDVRVPDMVYAAVLEAPVQGATPENVNAQDALAIPGVEQVLPMPFGVAVLGRTVEATRAGRNALKAKVTWNTANAPAANFDSEKAKAEYAEHAKNPPANSQPREAYRKGNAADAFNGAARVIEAAYVTEHTYHAQLEPMNCIARVAPDGQSAEVWVGTQAPVLVAAAASGVLKTTPDKIRIHQVLMGGGFGRRITPDIVGQTVAIANASKKTVKVLLSREDDFAAFRPRPMTHQVLRAALDDKGQIVGWRHRIVAENVDAVAAPPRFAATGGKDYIGWNGSDLPHYAIPNWLSEGVREHRGMRVHAFRGIGAGHNKFAIESFLDEIAHARKVDPLALRLELTKDDPRAHAVLRAAAEMSDWQRKRRAGRALGIAFGDYHGTVTAGVVEISLDRKSGQVKVHDLWIAVDPGLAVQPENVLAQLEGAAVWGLSVALKEQVTVKGGAAVQSNFHDYPVLRMSEMPRIHTRLVKSDAPPTGMGEAGVVAVAPAIANALFTLTGKRVRQLPMTPDNVRKVMA
ncbi:molybdopterin cofactor-binding domain-containing protein [Ramlibacter sp. MAHUQ-53]|uniref:xanthine dehydrogenase family protein molybdopterin-binding subunit n=1 Tax=unclassified Ramlibacter TaxID=2617605 RepID=UPI003638B014